MANICLNQLTMTCSKEALRFLFKRSEKYQVKYKSAPYLQAVLDDPDKSPEKWLVGEWIDLEFTKENQISMFAESKWQPPYQLIEEVVLHLGRKFKEAVVAELVFDESNSHGSGKFIYTYLVVQDKLDMNEGEDVGESVLDIHGTSFEQFIEYDEVLELINNNLVEFGITDESPNTQVGVLDFYQYCVTQGLLIIHITLSCHVDVFEVFRDAATQPKLETLFNQWQEEKLTG